MASRVSRQLTVARLQETKTYSDFGGGTPAATINIGSVLPADAHLLTGSIECTTVPAGGGVVTCTVILGDATDPNGIEVGADHIAGGVGVYDTLGAYITTAGGFSNATRQLQATLTVDGGHITQDLTQGVWIFRCAYAVFWS